MASNPYVNKVEYAGQTVMDLTGDTVQSSSVLNGVTFHDRSGAPQTGSMITHDVYDGLDSTSTDDALSANQGKTLNNKLIGTWNDFTTPASSGVTLINETTGSSGYIIRGGLCFVSICMVLDSSVGDTSKAIVSGLPTSLKATIKPPPWSAFAANNIIAESLLQNGTVYIRNAPSLPVGGRWNISFVYPVFSV